MTLIVMKTLERVYKNYYFIIRGEVIKGIEAVSAQAGGCEVLQSETYTGEGEALITVYERFTKKLAERMEQDDDEHNISGIQI